MSPEASRAQEALQMLTPTQREKITLSTIFFYVKYLRYEQIESVFNSNDISTSLKDLYDLVPKDQVEKDNPTAVVEALQAHPRRKEIFPEFDPFAYRIFFDGIEWSFNEQDMVEKIHGVDIYDDTTPAAANTLKIWQV